MTQPQRHCIMLFRRGTFRGLLCMAEVPPDCPMLMSKNVLKTWDVDMCVGKECQKIHKFDVTIPFNEQDVPIVNILDVAKGQLKAQWDKIPDMVKMENQPSKAVGRT